jgi:hypothetical protein
MKKYKNFIFLVGGILLTSLLNSTPVSSGNIGQTATLSADQKNDVQIKAGKSAGQSDSAANLFYSKYSDPREFIKLQWHEGMDYGMVRRTIKQDKLPLLYEMLKDRSYINNWDKIAQIIGYVSKDPNSIPVLLEYFQRVDDWIQLPETNGEQRFFGQTAISNIEHQVMGKISALRWIGIIGGKQANSILREAVTEKGAEELTSAWNNNAPISITSLLKSKEDVINQIRASAIYGIMCSGDTENIEIIKKLYEIEEEKCRSHNKDNSLEAPSSLHNSLVEAMGKLDYIKEHSLEDYLILTGDMTNYLETALHYERKYCSLLDEVCSRLEMMKKYEKSLIEKSRK